MTDVYSAVLGAALALLVGTLICCVSAHVSRSAHLFRLAQVGAVITVVALSVAVASHVRLGHPPGTEDALGLGGFITEHPMVSTVAVAAALLFTWAHRRARPPAV